MEYMRTYGYHKYEAIDLLTELTVCESLARPSFSGDLNLNYLNGMATTIGKAANKTAGGLLFLTRGR